MSTLHMLLNAAKPAAAAWAAEAEVVRRYFARCRTPEADIRWVRYQLFKEWSGSGVYGGPGTDVASLLADTVSRIRQVTLATEVVEMKQLVAELTFAADEFRHTSQLFELYRQLTTPDSRAIDALGDLKEGRALTALRHDLRETPIGRIVVDLSEGGGLGMYFGIKEHFVSFPPRDDIEVAIKDIAHRTLCDEVEHLVNRFASSLALGEDPVVWGVVAADLRRVCEQKLRERNEQFSHPLSDADLAACLADETAGVRYMQKHLPFLRSRLLGAS